MGQQFKLSRRSPIIAKMQNCQFWANVHLSGFLIFFQEPMHFCIGLFWPHNAKVRHLLSESLPAV